MIKHLSFSGGGVHGISYCGVIKALEEKGILDKIETICGTSAGSSIALMIVLGYTSMEIENLINGLNFENLRDITTDSIFGFFDNYGVDSGKKIISIIDIIIKRKINIINQEREENIALSDPITFKELFDLTDKKLIITGTNLTFKKTEYFDYLNTPNMSVSMAVRISMGIPILFSPVHYKDCLYIDGCVLDNFPIHILPNDETTLGITLRNTSKDKIDNIEDYIFTIISCLTCEFEKLKTDSYRDQILSIQIPPNISPLQFDINISQKQLLITEGYSQCMAYLEASID